MRTSVFFVLALSACAAAGPPAATPGTSARRVIKVCVLNDAGAPVWEHVIRESLEAASADYDGKVGIAFRIDAILPFRGDIDAWAVDQGPYLARVCPADTEIRIVYTNRFISRKSRKRPAHDGILDEPLAGRSSPYYGFILLYRTEERWAAFTKRGERPLVVTLKHEFGHLFGITHFKDRDSFMYTPSARSDGGWTRGLRRRIEAHKWKRWFRRPSPHG